jgi:serine/threonine protein kinase
MSFVSETYTKYYIKECNKTIDTDDESNEQILTNLKITDNTNGKGIQFAQGGFGKIYKVFKYYNDKNELKNIIPFAQKQTNIFETDGNIIGQNLKEVSIGYKYLNNSNTQKYNYVTIDETSDIVNSKYIINMLLADMNFRDLIYSKLSNDDRILYFFPLLKQIVNGLLYIHSNYINHGDIKPDNIFLYGEKENKENILDDIVNLKSFLKNINIQIADYNSINMEYNITMDKTSTLYYKSPELFVKVDKKFKKSVNETYGQFNDIWSIGITMLEYLTRSNIISKLYKKNMKFNEKEFLTRFYHCMKSIDVYYVMKNSGYDVENTMVKNICDILNLMLTKKIENRINMYNLTIYIHHFIKKNTNYYKINDLQSDELFKLSLFQNSIKYEDDIHPEFINIKCRENAIKKLILFIEDIDDMDTDIEFKKSNIYNNKQYLPLSILLFDRLISKNILKNEYNNCLEYMYIKTLIECYYISSKYLLSNIDIIHLVDYLNIDMEILHMDILEIIKLIDYDIYRPTILTFLNKQNEDVYHSQYIINNSIDTFCDCTKINTDTKSVINTITNVIKNDIEYIEKKFNEHVNDDNEINEKNKEYDENDGL